jgi:AraC-like DNA-binding protein
MPRRSQVLPLFMSKQVVDARRFFFDTTERGRDGLTVVSGGWERAGSNYSIHRAGFRYFGLEFVAGGQGTLRLRGRSRPVSRGTVFAYGPGVPHEIHTHPVDRLSKYFVDFSGAGVETALRQAGFSPGACHRVAAVEDVQATFEQILAAGRRGTRTAAEMTALHGRILLLLLSEARVPARARSNRSYQTFLRCREHLERTFATTRTAEEAAAACGVTPAYFSRLFRHYTGQPAYRFLMRLKMHHAAVLLEQRGMTVSTTAETFGMDPFHFSRAFKRVHGRAPAFFLRRDEA